MFFAAGGAYLVFRQIPVNIYDASQLENYLSYMAEQGLFLKKVFGFGIFERGIEEKTKYHIEPLDEINGSSDKEKLTQFEEAGWEYICNIADTFYILKAKSEDAKELSIEPDVLKICLNKAKKKSRNALLSVLFYFLFLMAFIAYDGFLFEFPGYFAINYNGISFILIWIFFTFVAIRAYNNFKNIRYCLKFGFDFSQKHTYPTQYRRLFVTATYILLWIFMISVYIYSHITRWEKPLTEYQGKHPGISLTTIETSPNLHIYEYEGDVKRDFRTNNIQYRWTELAPEIYEVEESGNIEGADESMELDTEYYTLRFQFLVDPFINDYMKYKKSFYYSKEIEWQSIENTKFEQAYYGHSGNYQAFFASVDNKVICVQYYGDEKVSDFGDKNLSRFSDEIYQALIQFDHSK